MNKEVKDSVAKELSRFGRYVIQQSRSRLTRLKHNDTKELYNSLKFEEKVMPNSFSLSFFMEEYGPYQDQGVKGAGQARKTTSKYKKTNNKGKMWKQNAPNSPFSYKKNGKKPPASVFKKYADSKGISPFAIAYSVWAKGLKPTMFFTTPFERAFERFPDELVEQFGLDVEEFFDSQMNNLQNK